LKRYLLLFASSLLLCLHILAQPGSDDPTFNVYDIGCEYGTGINNTISCSAMQPDGKIIIGGLFTYFENISQNHIARLNANGSLDSTFNVGGTGANAALTDIVLQPDGKIIVSGYFMVYNGTAKSCLVRLNPDGSIDPSFNSSGTGVANNAPIHSIVLQPDGKIIIGGTFTQYNGITQNKIARLNSDGTLDLSFNIGTGIATTGMVHALALQPDGKILVGGRFTTYNGIARNKMARLNPDGTLDIGFNTPGVNGIGTPQLATVHTFLVQPNGKIVVGGDFGYYGNKNANNIVRIHANSVIDTSFSPLMIWTGWTGSSVTGAGTDSPVYDIAIQPDGKLLVGGGFLGYNGTAFKSSIMRLNINGTFDPSFNSGQEAQGVKNIIIQPDGKIFLGGDFTPQTGANRNRATRLNADGSLDVGFYHQQTGANGSVHSIAPLPNGKSIITGFFTTYNKVARNRIAQINVDGSVDTTFNPGIGVEIGRTAYAIVPLPDGKIIIGGDFAEYNGISKKYLARLHSDGSLDNSFSLGNGIWGRIWVAALQPDGKILIGGELYNNQTQFKGIFRLNSDGSIDPTFNIGTGGPNGRIEAIALQQDGKIIVGGPFTQFNGNYHNRLVRLNPSGSLDASFNTNGGASGSISNNIKSIVAQPDGKILVGGEFTTFGGSPRNRIARLNPNGSLDTDFNPGSGANGMLNNISVQTDGKIIIAGAFTTYNNIPKNRIVQLNTDGSLDNTFDIGLGANGTIQSMTLLPSGSILIGGEFTTYNGICRNRISRVQTCATFSDTTVSTCTDFTWYGNTYNASGNYTRTLTNAAGCDSLITLHLVISSSSVDTTAIVCENFSWYGNSYSTTGDYTHMFTNVAGCDSSVTLHLTVNTPSVGDTTTIACGSYTWYGNSYSATGNYTYVLTNVAGCDSTVTLHLTVNTPSVGDTTTIACGSYTWYGSSYSATGNYTHVLTNVAGCDSTVTLHLTVNTPSVGDTTTIACGSYTWYGNSYSATGNYTHILPNVSGCDSVITLHLIVNNSTLGDTAAVVCGNFIWYGNNYSATGDYTHTLANSLGCDSTVTLHLTVNNPTLADISATACGSYIWYGNSYSATGNYTHILPNVSGCDSVITLHLTVNNSTLGDTAAVVCGNFIWYGNNYSATGDYTHTLANSLGCDSTVTLHLTVSTPSLSNITVVACNSHIWYGNTYFISGNYVHLLTNAMGCDSLVTLHLTINPPVTGEIFATGCDDYIWYGNNYSISGDYIHSATNISGCDSTITLHLTINSSTTGDTTVTAINNFMWYGTSYITSGNYQHTLINTAGCDSTVTLNLTILSPAAAIYPNPNNGIFNILLPNGWNSAQIIISNANGTQVYNAPVYSPTFPMQLQLQPGLYFIQFISNGQTVSQTFIVI